MKTVRESMSTSTLQHQAERQKNSLEARIFKLKLEWIRTSDANEKKRLSEEIRRLISSEK
jgi:hypothetical protein